MLGIVPALTVLFGIFLIVAGLLQAPRDDRAAAAFRNDPGCQVDLASGRAAGGACRVVVVRITDASLRATGGTRSTSTTPYVAFILPNGTRRSVTLVDADGRNFVRQVYPDTPGRALLFDGQVVRVAANGIAADADTAPTRMASSDAVLPWIGGGIVVFGLLIFWLGRRIVAASRSFRA